MFEIGLNREISEKKYWFIALAKTDKTQTHKTEPKARVCKSDCNTWMNNFSDRLHHEYAGMC